jgi:molecular chaperone DnaK (HSP70)
VQGVDLLDEPVAAFLDYLVDHSQNLLPALETPKNLVVFDFGGGTCDVAVFQVKLSRGQDPIQIAPLTVSRYHRLGGGIHGGRNPPVSLGRGWRKVRQGCQ